MAAGLVAEPLMEWVHFMVVKGRERKVVELRWVGDKWQRYGATICV